MSSVRPAAHAARASSARSRCFAAPPCAASSPPSSRVRAARRTARRWPAPRVDNGFGNLCPVPAARASSAARPRREMAATGLPVAFASQTAPAWATRAGPRGPSTVNAAGRPAAMSRFNCSRALQRAARRGSSRGPVAEALDDAGDPFAVEVLAGDDHDAAAAEDSRWPAGSGRARTP